MKIYYHGKLIRDDKGRFYSIKTSVKYYWFLFIKLVKWGTVSGALLYGAFLLGAYSGNPVTVFASKEVIVESKELPPVLKRICKAESGNRQFNEKGDVLRGRTTPSDLGYCQINEIYHNDQARKMGIDLYTEEGNKAYAKYLFETQGSEPWKASKCSTNKRTNCW